MIIFERFKEFKIATFRILFVNNNTAKKAPTNIFWVDTYLRSQIKPAKVVPNDLWTNLVNDRPLTLVNLGDS